MRPAGLAAVILLSVLANRACACTPVAPLTLVFITGPVLQSLLTMGPPLLLAVVLLKCALFARARTPFGRGRAFFEMLMGNVKSTVVGLVLTLVIVAPFLVVVLFGLLPLFVLVTWWRSLEGLAKAGSRKVGLSRAGWGLALTACFFASAWLLGVSQTMLDSFDTMSLSLYWLIKWGSATLSLVLGLGLSTAIETSSILARNRDLDQDQIEQVALAVLEANVWTFLVISAIGAALALPARFQSPRRGLISSRF